MNNVRSIIKNQSKVNLLAQHNEKLFLPANADKNAVMYAVRCCDAVSKEE